MIIIEERQPSLGGWIMPWPDKEGVRSNLKVLTHVKKEYVDDGWGIDSGGRTHNGVEV